MVLSDSNFILKDYNESVLNHITASGTYSLSFNVFDFAGNILDTNTKITLSITT
jgi:hypothetical protein